MTHNPDIFAALAAPFDDKETKQRAGSGGDKLTYVTERTVLNRLDQVLGPENWDETTRAVGGGSPNYRCRLTIRLPDGTTSTKTGVGAPGSDKAKTDPGKAASSDALKRAAQKFGVARYLYRDGVPRFVQERTGLHGPEAPVLHRDGVEASLLRDTRPPPEAGPSRVERLVAHCLKEGLMGQALALAKGKFGVSLLTQLDDGQALSVWKLLRAVAPVPPDRIKSPPPRDEVQAPALRTENGEPIAFGWPRHGGALYAWAKNLEQAYSIGVIRRIDEFARGKRWETMYNKWTPEQVEEGAKVAARLIATRPGYDGQFDDHIPDPSALKANLIKATVDLLRHLGNPSPSFDDIRHAIRARSEGLPADVAGGEVLGDLDACDDLRLLEATLAAVALDVADAEVF